MKFIKLNTNDKVVNAELITRINFYQIESGMTVDMFFDHGHVVEDHFNIKDLIKMREGSHGTVIDAILSFYGIN